ncbi:MAG: hypothetical protein M3016_08630 [Actinomycetota bacterium]|nr:hypothetical protein [Actinomycetota bacterium]
MRAVPVALAAAIVATLSPTAASANALSHDARLEGFFQANGVVTKAVGIPGERRGQHVTRTWQFIPSCPTGVCATVQLVRGRAHGFDRLRLHRRRPGYYTGIGSFLVAVRCAGRRYAAGERARYTITLTITSTVAQGANVIATGFTATYRNPVRVGLTPCYSAPSYDSAHYHGVPAPPPPAASIRTERRIRSSTGS